jgi:hypothetical protein
VVLVAAVLGALVAGALAAAPVSVISISLGLGDAAPPEAVRCVRFTDGREVGVEVGMVLDAGDRIWSAADGVDLRLACGEDSLHTLSGRFQAFVDFPGEAACSIKMIGGDIDVLADQPVRTDVAGIVLGNEGTQYAVRLDPSGDALAEVLVFDGKVRASAPGQTEEIVTGSGLQLRRSSRFAGPRRRIGSVDAERSAAVYARTDLAVARGGYSPVADPRREYDALARLHFAVLTDPDSQDVRAALARAQIRLGLCDEAFYHLKRGDLLSKKRLRRHDIDRDALERGLSPGNRAELDKALKGGGIGKALGTALAIGVGAVLVHKALDGDDDGDRSPDPANGGDDGANEGNPNQARACSELTALIGGGQIARAEELAAAQIQRQQALSCHYYALAKGRQARGDGKGFSSYCSAALELHVGDRQLTPAQVRDCQGHEVD